MAGGGDPLDATVERAPFTTGASTLAGWMEAGDVDGPREINLFHDPTGVAVGPDGRLLVADFDNGKIRAVDAAGTASTVFSGQGFSRPFSLAVAGDAVYVQTDNDPDNGHGLASGTLWRLDVAAGSMTAIAPKIGRPRGIAILGDGRLAVADYAHHVIELVEPSTGQVAVLAGGWDDPGYADEPGAEARFDTPYGLVVRPDGVLVVADWGNHRLRTVGLDGTVTTLAGDGTPGFADGDAAGARFEHPQALAIAASGDVFVTDRGNLRIRRVRGGVVDTVAGDGGDGYADDADPLASRFHGLEGIAVSADGATLYVADGTGGEDLPYNRIRTVALQPTAALRP